MGARQVPLRMSGSNDLLGRLGYFGVAAAVLFADQITKALAQHYLADRAPVEVVPNLVNLWYSRNPGGLFGYFRDWGTPWRTMLLTLLPALAVLLIGSFLVRSREVDRVTLTGLALILGGAVGNLIDRLLRGEVIDFVDVYAGPSRVADWLVGWFGTAHWPTFNLADSAIVVGAACLVLRILRPHQVEEAERRPASSAS